MPFDMSGGGEGRGNGCPTCEGYGLVQRPTPFIRPDLFKDDPASTVAILPKPCPTCKPDIHPGLCTLCFGAGKIMLVSTIQCSSVGWTMVQNITRVCPCKR